MNRVLHIFFKDVRHLLGEIPLVLLLAAISAFLDVRLWPGIGATGWDSVAAFTSVILPIGIAILVARLVFEEALPGDTQFWLTRPYRRLELFLAKFLFLFLFINIPLFLSDCYILAAQRFAVVGVLPQLLLRQVFVTIAFILPSLTIATLTRNVTQFVMAWLGLCGAVICQSIVASVLAHGPGAGAVAFWMIQPAAVNLSLIGSILILWQYATRRTAIARLVAIVIVLAAGPILWAFPWRLGVRVSAPHSYGSRVVIAYNLSHPRPTSQESSTEGSVRFITIKIPLTVTGMLPGTLLRGRSATTIEVQGQRWPEPSVIDRTGDEYVQILRLDASKIGILRDHPATIRSEFDLEIVTDVPETSVPVSKEFFCVPGVGLCRNVQGLIQLTLTCRAGLEPTTETGIALSTAPRLQPESALFVAKTSVPWGLSPVSNVGTSTMSDVPPSAKFLFIPRRRIGELSTTLELRDFHVAEFLLIDSPVP